jgi:DNA-binding NtrC family response regulator
VKVVAASNRPLDDAVADGRFRPDLYMRLSPATRIRIPELSERPADLPFLARRFVDLAVRDADIAELRDEIAGAVGLAAGPEVLLELERGAAGGERDALVLALPGPAWKLLEGHGWPGNMRELAMVMHNVVAFTFVATVDAIRSGLPLTSNRLQVDPGLVGELLAGASAIAGAADEDARERDPGGVAVQLAPGPTLNAVANSVERQYFLELFKRTGGDFKRMAELLLDDPSKGRSVRLRFNQLGLKVRELTGR